MCLSMRVCHVYFKCMCYLNYLVSIQALTVQQIKKLQILIDESHQKCTARMKECEAQRDAHLTQIGNILHPSVPISDNEVWVLDKNEHTHAHTHYYYSQ